MRFISGQNVWDCDLLGGVIPIEEAAASSMAFSTVPASEVEHAMNRLNNNRASGSDELPGELLKHGSNVIAKPIADIFNRAITDQEVLSQIGHEILILLPKPGKPIGAMTSLRHIALLNTLRKTLSLIVLSRISDKVDEFLYSVAPRTEWISTRPEHGRRVIWLPLASGENATFSKIFSRTGY